MQFRTGQKLTIIGVSDFGRMPYRKHIQITRFVDGQIAYRVRNRLKHYYLVLEPNMLVLDGWGLPFSLHAQTFNGPAEPKYLFQYNSSEGLKKMLIQNLNPLFNSWDMVYLEQKGLLPVQLFTSQEIHQLCSVYM